MKADWRLWVVAHYRTGGERSYFEFFTGTVEEAQALGQRFAQQFISQADERDEPLHYVLIRLELAVSPLFGAMPE